MQAETYERLEILKELAEDLWDSEGLALCNASLDLLLTLEQGNERHEAVANRRALLDCRAEIARKDKHKARLTWKRYLSSWELELEFLDVNGESFTKLYSEDSYEYQRNKEREKKHEEKWNEIQTKKETFASFFSMAS